MSDEQLSNRQKVKLAAAFVLVFLLGILIGLQFCSPGDTGDLTVDVVDENGDPINSAKVSLDGGNFTPVTGPDASHVFTDVSGGTHTVSADAPQYTQNSTQVFVNGDTSATVVLSEIDPSKPSEWTERFK